MKNINKLKTKLISKKKVKLKKKHCLPDKPALRRASTRFFARPRRFSYFDVSIDAARRRTDLPGWEETIILFNFIQK